MRQIYDTDSALHAYQYDTGGHFFDADTMRFFGCKVVESTILGDRDDTREVIFILRQLRNGFESATEKIYRVANYIPGTDHRCECCHQRDQRGTIDYISHGRDDEGYELRDFETLRAARKFVAQYVGSRQVAQ